MKQSNNSGDINQALHNQSQCQQISLSNKLEDDEDADKNTEKVYSIFSNYWEQKYKVSDSLREIFPENSNNLDEMFTNVSNFKDLESKLSLDK